MEKRQCMRCHKGLPYGSLVYSVQIKVVADFDGVIPDSEEDETLFFKKLLEQVKTADPKELEKEVYEEYGLILCKHCRDRFVEETQHPWEGTAPFPKSPGSFLH